MTVKAAVLASGRSEPDRIFPEFFAAPDVEALEKAAEARGDEIVYDYSDVQFEMPSEEDMAETLRLMQSMGANLSLSVGEDDDDWSPEPEPGSQLLDPSEVVDREWL